MEYREQARRHLEQINELVGVVGYDPEKWAETWEHLRSVEAEAEALATTEAAGKYKGEDYDAEREAMEQRIKALFVRGESVEYNTDPRGYAIKIRGDFKQLPIFTDWGGSVPVCPEKFK